jgi:hypothetical protein
MSDRWGVRCATCDEYIELGQQDPIADMVAYLPPLDAIPCGECGAQHLYSSKDVVDEDGVSLSPLLESE